MLSESEQDERNHLGTQHMSNKTKPSWLESLEDQSWQAELIASGLAIYGSISMGPLLDDALSFCAAVFPDRVLAILMFMFIYLYLAQSVLVVAFIAHLILRIVWAGLLGLSSAYPNGINIDNKTYADHFLEKAKEEFPSLSDYSIEVDKICSRVFANLCFVLFIFFSFFLWSLIVLGINEIIFHFFKTDALFYLLAIIAVFYLLSMVLSLLFVMGPKKESPFAKKYAYPYFQWFSKVLMLNFYKPANYIMWIQRTNQTTSQFLFGFLLLFPISVYTGFKTSKVMAVIEPERYFEMNAIAYEVSEANYLDTNGDQRILRPMIQSERIYESHIELFIPDLKREEIYREEVCGAFDIIDKKDIKNKIRQSAFKERCAKEYYDISIDGIPQGNLSYEFRKHILNGEKGVITYIPIDTFTTGSHKLQIKTGYKNEAGEYALRIIPFFKM